jgi:D-xylono/L-arabinono-1,4-lactonase
MTENIIATAALGPARLLVRSNCKLGEGPFWDGARDGLLWTDIDNGALHFWDRATGRARQVYSGDPVGGFTMEPDGRLALFRVHDIALFDLAKGVVESIPFSDPGMARFNDVTADFEGRVFAGTIGKDEASGGLHRIDPDGSTRLLFRGTGVSNGMGFSPDGHTFYWTCSTTARIFAFSYDRSNGEVSGRRVFYACTPAEGAPDGLCIDREGFIWSARWGGYCLARHEPNSGRIVEKVDVPASCVTSCCFGGPSGSDLFVTSARPGGEPESSLAGGLFTLPTRTSGLPSLRSRLF